MGLFKRKKTVVKEVRTLSQGGELMPISTYTFLGNSVSNYLNKAYGENPHVYSIVNYIARQSSTLPFVDLPKELSIYTIQDVLISLLVTGNVFLLKETAIGFKGTQRYTVLNTSAVELIFDNLGEIQGYAFTGKQGHRYIYTLDDIIHIKYNNLIDKDTKGNWGLSPLRAGSTTYQSSNNNIKAAASIFDNFGATGILTNDSDVPILESERENKDNIFKLRAAGVKQYGKTLTSNYKLRYIQIGMSPTALKLIENNISSLRTLCNIYGISSLLFNDHVASTKDNLTIASRNFYTEVAIPLMNYVLQTINNIEGYNISIAVDEISQLQTVNSELSTKVINEINAGILTVQEAKKLLYG